MVKSDEKSATHLLGRQMEGRYDGRILLWTVDVMDMKIERDVYRHTYIYIFFMYMKK